jgi:Fe-Mn family superoxide dismutase
MKKREFLRNLGLSTIGLIGSKFLFSAIRQRNDRSLFISDELDGDIADGPFKLPALGYAYNALEPYIDAQTMEIHYTKHHQGYVNKLNAAVAGTPFEKMDLEKILMNVTNANTAVRNNGGGHYNHSMFWQWLSPDKKILKDGKLKAALIANFGSIEKFQEKFDQEAASRFGSGWAWLVKGANGKLYVTSTPNQDNPLMRKLGYKGTPLLGIDVWEHAYYLKYQNKRGDYVKNFWNLVNWDRVETLYNA